MLLKPTRIDLIDSIDAWNKNYGYEEKESSPPMPPTGVTKTPEEDAARKNNFVTTLLYNLLAVTVIVSICGISIFLSGANHAGAGGGFMRGNNTRSMMAAKDDPTFIIHASTATTTRSGLGFEYALALALSRDKELSLRSTSNSKYRYLNCQQAGCNKEESNENMKMESLLDDVISCLEEGESPIYTSADIANVVLQIYQQGKNTTLAHSTSTSSHTMNMNVNSKDSSNLLHLLHRLEEGESQDWKVMMEYQRYYEFIPAQYHHQLESFLKGASFRDLSSQKLKSLLSYESFINAKEEGALRDFGSGSGSSNDVHPLQLYQMAFRDVLGVELEVMNPYPYPSQPESARNDFLYNLSQIIQERKNEIQKMYAEVPLPEIYENVQEVDVGYMHLTIAAYSMGLVSIRAGSPWSMVQNLAEHHDEIMRMFSDDDNDSNDYDRLPLSCMSEEALVNLYESSARFEQELFDHWSSSDLKFAREHHLQAFTRDVEENKFCEWDVKRMLTNGRLRDFIRRLSASTRNPVTKLKMASLWKDEL